MLFNRIVAVLTVIALAMTFGCSAKSGSKGYCYEKGQVGARVQKLPDGWCKIDFSYQNLAKHMQKPIIYINVYNGLGKMIDQEEIRFPEINPRAGASVSKNLQCEGQDVARIYIRDARNAARCYGYDCSALCDISGTDMKFFK